AGHYGDFFPIVNAGNRGDHITVKTVRRGPRMYRSLPTAVALAKRIEFVEGRGPASFIHEQLHCDEPGIIRLISWAIQIPGSITPREPASPRRWR
ncbi:MAG: hypothetical protein ABUS51_08205, partial [Acidobacteriota bacterium]